MINDDNIVLSIGICNDVDNIFLANDNTEDGKIGVAIHVYSKISHFSPIISRTKSSPKELIFSLIKVSAVTQICCSIFEICRQICCRIFASPNSIFASRFCPRDANMLATQICR